MKKVAPRSLLVTVLFIFSFSSFAQSISGTLVDKNTGKTIPFATVQLGEDYGVVTNQEGDFIINTKNFKPADSLIFTSMGYERKAIVLKDYKKDTVYLKPNITKLEEVYLMGKELTARQVMDSVKKYVDENYDFSYSGFKVFRRNKNSITPGEVEFDVRKARNLIDKQTIKKFNKTVDSIAKAARGLTTTSYNAFLAEAVTLEEDTMKMRVNKATTLVNKEKNINVGSFAFKIIEKLGKNLKTQNTFKVRTGLIPLADSMDVSEGFKSMNDSSKVDSLLTSSVYFRLRNILEGATFNNEGGSISISIGGTSGGRIANGFIFELDDYNYKIEDLSTFGGELAYVISFKPDKSLFGNQGKYKGTLYVSADSYAVVKMEYHFAEGERGPKLNLKFLLGVKYAIQKHSGTVIYQRLKNGKYVPKYVRVGGQRYGFFSRKFVFKENDEKRKNRIKLKFDFTIELTNNFQDEWLFINTEKISKAEFSKFKMNRGVMDKHIEEYNPKIWEDYNILAPTEAIREYRY